MDLLGPVRQWLRGRKRRRTGEAIAEAYARAGTFALSPATPVVIFSDHHRGGRDGADDFQRCERTYNAALAYYFELGYHLMELGDVEELWENTFDEVVASYPVTLALAARFREVGRYTRFFGNHDLAWSEPELFRQRMWERGYDGVVPIEALRILVGDGTAAGELFLVHGHQGTADSDRRAKLSEFSLKRGRVSSGVG
jgi:hypothetical protein